MSVRTEFMGKCPECLGNVWGMSGICPAFVRHARNQTGIKTRVRTWAKCPPCNRLEINHGHDPPLSASQQAATPSQ